MRSSGVVLDVEEWIVFLLTLKQIPPLPAFAYACAYTHRHANRRDIAATGEGLLLRDLVTIQRKLTKACKCEGRLI